MENITCKNCGKIFKDTKKEHVHHIDFDKTNNKIENLYLFESNSLHWKFHQSLQNSVAKALNLEKYLDKVNRSWRWRKLTL